MVYAALTSYTERQPTEILESSGYYGLPEETIVLFREKMAGRNLK